MSIIKQITASEFEQVVLRACIPHVVWFDGTAETGGLTFVGFHNVVEQFAVHLHSVARVVLVNSEVSDETTAHYGVIGSPELVLFKHGSKIAHQIGTASLDELMLWARPHLTGLPTRWEW